MKSKIFKLAIIIFIALTIIYWLPFIIILLSSQSNIVTKIDEIPNADAVIIFGTLVNDTGEITPLLQERLDAGIAILKAGKSDKILVSNTENAANTMVQYLLKNGVSTNLIEIDTQADKTPDTCKNEKTNHPENRKLIFVSQSFHLPRLLYQCNKVNALGTAFPAELLNQNTTSADSFLTKITVRIGRYIREAGLTWLVFLNIYS